MISEVCIIYTFFPLSKKFIHFHNISYSEPNPSPTEKKIYFYLSLISVGTYKLVLKSDSLYLLVSVFYLIT